MTNKMYVHSGLSTVDKEIEQIEESLIAKKQERVCLIKQNILMCSHCGKPTTIGDTIYLQTQWYIRPYGCSDGDYWRDGEGQYQCPHCLEINRLYNHKEIEELKPFFKSIERVRED